MVYKHLRGAIETEVCEAAVEEMRGAFAASRAGLSMVCWLRKELKPQGSVRPEFAAGAGVNCLVDRVLDVFAAQLPDEFEIQNGPRIPFNTITVNRNWATPLHRDTGTRAGSVVALVIVKDGDVTCPTEFRDEETGRAWEEDLGSGDVVLFQGVEMEHGNSRGRHGGGERWAFVIQCGVCYTVFNKETGTAEKP
jgi:hypothetical protein